MFLPITPGDGAGTDQVHTGLFPQILLQADGIKVSVIAEIVCGSVGAQSSSPNSSPTLSLCPLHTSPWHHWVTGAFMTRLLWVPHPFRAQPLPDLSALRPQAGSGGGSWRRSQPQGQAGGGPQDKCCHCIGPFPPQTSGPSQRPSSAPPGPYLGSLICSLVSLQPPLYSLFTEPVSRACV